MIKRVPFVCFQIREITEYLHAAKNDLEMGGGIKI